MSRLAAYTTIRDGLLSKADPVGKLPNMHEYSRDAIPTTIGVSTSDEVYAYSVYLYRVFQQPNLSEEIQGGVMRLPSRFPRSQEYCVNSIVPRRYSFTCRCRNNQPQGYSESRGAGGEGVLTFHVP